MQLQFPRFSKVIHLLVNNLKACLASESLEAMRYQTPLSTPTTDLVISFLQVLPKPGTNLISQRQFRHVFFSEVLLAKGKPNQDRSLCLHLSFYPGIKFLTGLVVVQAKVRLSFVDPKEGQARFPAELERLSEFSLLRARAYSYLYIGTPTTPSVYVHQEPSFPSFLASPGAFFLC